MAAYAIVQASGKQFWVEENRFYNFDKLPLMPGEVFKLNRVLLMKKHDLTLVGKPFLHNTCLVEATVIRHLASSKVRVYKMRSKKKTRRTFGSRSKLTRIIINSITPIKSTSSTCYL